MMDLTDREQKLVNFCRGYDGNSTAHVLIRKLVAERDTLLRLAMAASALHDCFDFEALEDVRAEFNAAIAAWRAANPC